MSRLRDLYHSELEGLIYILTPNIEKIAIYFHYNIVPAVYHNQTAEAITRAFVYAMLHLYQTDIDACLAFLWLKPIPQRLYTSQLHLLAPVNNLPMVESTSVSSLDSGSANDLCGSVGSEEHLPDALISYAPKLYTTIYTSTVPCDGKVYSPEVSPPAARPTEPNISHLTFSVMKALCRSLVPHWKLLARTFNVKVSSVRSKAGNTDDIGLVRCFLLRLHNDGFNMKHLAEALHRHHLGHLVTVTNGFP